MPQAKANGITLEYDTFGEKSNPAMLLIMGLGGQMIAWDEKFCNGLADEGFYVIRFDNRDIGLSTKFEEAGIPKLPEIMAKAMQGEKIESPYTLDDMADDAVGLLDALGIEKAHICGASMGAAITQTVGYLHQDQVLSLIPIMGTTGNPDLPPAKPEASAVLVAPAPTDRQGVIDNSVKNTPVMKGPGFPFDEERTREFAARAYDRSFYPQGMARQLVAIMAHGNRKPRLAQVTVPTLVIHGTDDPLVPVEGGKDTHDAIKGSEILLIKGMGHEMPPEVWPQLIEAISAHAKKAQS